MKSLVRAALAAGTLMAFPLSAAADPLNHEQLTSMIKNMGYEAKEIGKTTPKLEITLTTPQFNVPAGIEITPSGRFIWITANLGESKLDGDKALQLLKRSKEWQPTQYWITDSNTLTVGLALNNIEIKPENMKFALEKLGADVAKSADLWQ